MNLTRLADIDNEIAKYEDGLMAPDLTDNQKTAIWKHIERLENERNRLLGDEIFDVHKKPWDDDDHY